MSQLHPAVTAPLPDVGTPRLTLHRLAADDLDELTTIFADADVWRFEYDRGLTRAESEEFLDRQTRMWVECGFGGCAVRDRVNADLIGVAGLGVATVTHELLPAVTIGWRFSPAVWGHGYATEAATGLLEEAFTTMGVDRIGCVTDARNHRSLAVAARLGMSSIGDTNLPSDDGSSLISARLLQLARDDWIVTHGRSRSA